MRDISEQRRAARKHEQERSLRGALDASLVGILLLDADFRVVWVNSALEAYFGLERATILGRSKPDLIRDRIRHIFEHPEQFATRVLATYADNTYVDLFECHVLPDGDREERWLEHRSRPILTGSYAGGRIEQYYDVTARKRAQDRSEFLTAALSATTDFIGQLDPDLRPIYLNPAGRGMLGVGEDEDLSRYSLWDFHPEAARATLRNEALPTAARDGVWTGELAFRSLTGREMVLSMVLTAHRSSTGEVVRFAGTGRDVSVRRAAEAEIQESHARLRRLAVRLQEVREEERTLMARDIHDELGQAVTSLKFDLAWLSDRLAKGPDPLRDRVASMVSLVDGMRDTVRELAARLRPAILDDLGLEAAVEWQLRDFANRTGCGHELHLECEGLRPVRDRDTTVFRVLQEALTNITRHSRADRVSVRLAAEGGDLILRVRDNGRGITDEAVASPDSLGLLGMRERAGALGGRVQIDRRGGGARYARDARDAARAGGQR